MPRPPVGRRPRSRGEGMTAKIVGGATGARTPDLLHAMQALFQLSYSPAVERQYSSGPGSIRRAGRVGQGGSTGRSAGAGVRTTSGSISTCLLYTSPSPRDGL